MPRYRLIFVGHDHPLAMANGCAYEHRLRAWEAGTLRRRSEVVARDGTVYRSNAARAAARRTHERRCTCGCGRRITRRYPSGQFMRFATKECQRRHERMLWRWRRRKSHRRNRRGAKAAGGKR